MQDLIGIRIADPAEDPGVGERALQRMILSRYRSNEGFRLGLGDLQPPRILIAQPLAPTDDVQGGTFLGPCLGENERAVLELERCEQLTPATPRQLIAPLKATRNHQMEHEPEFPLEPNRNSLTDALEPQHPKSLSVLETRLDRAQQKRVIQLGAEQLSPLDADLERFQIQRDVRKLRHVRSSERRAPD